MIITNSDIYIEATSNDIEKINNLEYDIINFTEHSIIMKDGSSIDIGGNIRIKDNKICIYFEYKNNFINLDDIDSIVIDSNKIKISD